MGRLAQRARGVGSELRELRLLGAAQPVMPPILMGAKLIGPMRRIPKLGLVITDPDIARDVLHDNDSFSIVGEGGVGHWWAQMLGDWVVDMFEGDGHATIRHQVRDLFTAKHVSAVVDRVLGDLLGELEEELAAGKPVDIAARCRVLTGRLAADMVGMDAEFVASAFPGVDEDARFEEVFAMSERLANLGMGTLGSTAIAPERVAEGRALTSRLTANVPRAYSQADPSTTIGRCRELGVPVEQTAGLAVLMTAAGTDTVVSAMTRIVAILADTGSCQALIDNPELIPGAVREGLRVVSPVVMVGRGATRDVTVGAHRVRRGDQVKIFIWTINQGGGFDVHRRPGNRQLWFGGGPHLCLGLPVVYALTERLLGVMTSPWQVVSRKPARNVLVPTYDRLVIQAV